MNQIGDRSDCIKLHLLNFGSRSIRTNNRHDHSSFLNDFLIFVENAECRMIGATVEHARRVLAAGLNQSDLLLLVLLSLQKVLFFRVVK